MASISISIPAYNEEATIEGLIRESFRVLGEVTTDAEVVVVNDGSHDGTRAILDRLTTELPGLKVIHHGRNLGFGQTLKDVFQTPTKELIFFIPGDGQIHPGEIHRLLPGLMKADFILGWRDERKDGGVRWLLSALYNYLISVLLRRTVHDVDSVALVRREVVHAIDFKNNSAFFHAEFLLETNRLGFRWLEIPIEHRPRTSGRSTVFKLKVMIPAFKDFFRYLLS
jgi:glycosyltransferase involved in cell wall biosynthesis